VSGRQDEAFLGRLRSISSVGGRVPIEMKRASKSLEFERAAELRDEIARLKRLLPDDRSSVSLAKTRPPAAARRSGRG
jgi:excinuclease UvrABC nuclease subunit